MDGFDHGEVERVPRDVSDAVPYRHYHPVPPLQEMWKRVRERSIRGTPGVVGEAAADVERLDVTAIDDERAQPMQPIHDPLPDTLPEGKGVFDAPEEDYNDLRGLDAATASMQPLDPADAESAERIALARTYLELEDDVTARMLLEQVIDRGGVHGEEARRMLDRFDPS